VNDIKLFDKQDGYELIAVSRRTVGRAGVKEFILKFLNTCKTGSKKGNKSYISFFLLSQLKK
jgi:hypothetical protein